MKKLLEKFLALPKKTRIISIVLAAVILCGAITGIAIGASKCGGSNGDNDNSTSTPSEESSSVVEEPEIPSFSAFIGEPCTVTIGADDEYVLVYCKIFADVTVSWEGDATVMMGKTEITNNSTIESQGKVVEFKVSSSAGTVVMTFSEIAQEAAKELIIGENAVAFAGEIVEYTFTATEAGTYQLSLAEGEDNASVSCEYLKYLFDNGEPVLDSDGNQMSNLITEPCEFVDEDSNPIAYEITLAQGETITFYVSAQDEATTEDIINLVWSKKL